MFFFLSVDVDVIGLRLVLDSCGYMPTMREEERREGWRTVGSRERRKGTLRMFIVFTSASFVIGLGQKFNLFLPLSPINASEIFENFVSSAFLFLTLREKPTKQNNTKDPSQPTDFLVEILCTHAGKS